MILRDSMDYVEHIENTYRTEEEITFGPMNNVENLKKPRGQLFPISIHIQPMDAFFWEMEPRDGIKIPPICGLIISLLVGPFMAVVIIHTEVESSYKSIYYYVSRSAIGINCLVSPLVDILLLFHITKHQRWQPLWPFLVWLFVKTLSAAAMVAHIYYIYAILGEVKAAEQNPCYKFMRDDCSGANLFHYQMGWFKPVYQVIAVMKLYFLWLVTWYAINCRYMKPQPPRTKYVEEVDWYFYKPNPLYGMGFSYWDNFDTENPQGEIQEYYSDLISKGLKIQPPHQNDLYEMFNYATSSGSCPL